MKKKRRKQKRVRQGHNPGHSSGNCDLPSAEKSFNRPETSAIESCIDHSLNDAEPPRFCLYLLERALRKKTPEYVIGDLIQDYRRRQYEVGTRKARIWFYSEVAFLVWERIPRPIKHMLYTWVDELFRRHG